MSPTINMTPSLIVTKQSWPILASVSSSRSVTLLTTPFADCWSALLSPEDFRPRLHDRPDLHLDGHLGRNTNVGCFALPLIRLSPPSGWLDTQCVCCRLGQWRSVGPGLWLSLCLAGDGDPGPYYGWTGLHVRALHSCSGASVCACYS